MGFRCRACERWSGAIPSPSHLLLILPMVRRLGPIPVQPFPISDVLLVLRPSSQKSLLMGLYIAQLNACSTACMPRRCTVLYGKLVIPCHPEQTSI